MEIPVASIGSVKSSYFNILALFLEREKMESRFVTCLLKWGFQLKLTAADIDAPQRHLDQIRFEQPADRVAQLEAIYHLVQMIYLDNVVEDVELEVASVYAEKLGFEREIVGDLLKSIATKDGDGVKEVDIRREVRDFLRVEE